MRNTTPKAVRPKPTPVTLTIDADLLEQMVAGAATRILARKTRAQEYPKSAMWLLGENAWCGRMLAALEDLERQVKEPVQMVPAKVLEELITDCLQNCDISRTSASDVLHSLNEILIKESIRA